LSHLCGPGAGYGVVMDSPQKRRRQRRSVRKAVAERVATRLGQMSDVEIESYLSDAIYLERLRFRQERPIEPRDHEEREQVEAAARAVHQGRPEIEAAVGMLVKGYANEIHNRFSDRTYGIAAKLAPGALTRLLTAANPTERSGFDPENRIVVHGPTDAITHLAKTHTLILVPTHVSNLDSPVVGYALHQSSLPPFIYGAGLNLFTNPALAFFMSRLGAYTVDRRKRHRIYKDVLKDYSRERIGRGDHSLFYPGGTRSRSGRIEPRIKRGLLGTAIDAWQEGVATGRPNSEVLVVPCTLSFSLVLEAETLIGDSLSGEGKSQYIIFDDESTQPTTLVDFAKRALNLDASVHVRFGHPLDLFGNPVNDDGQSTTRSGDTFDRLFYVADRAGNIIADRQRDRAYTDQLAAALTAAYHRDNTVLSTHLAARAAWDCLVARYPRLDVYRLALLSTFERWLDRERMMSHLRTLLTEVKALEAKGAICTALPDTGDDPAEAVLLEAVGRFKNFHAQPALAFEDWRVIVDPKLTLYYGNRLCGYGLTKAPREEKP
jgi:glycerol-3-phosphate O-acyltransferase